MSGINQNRSVRVLAVDAFHGGSHRQFVEGVIKHSRHQWHLLAGKPVRWKWRMRSGAIEMANRAIAWMETGGQADVMLCTDMLDLPTWRGLLRQMLVRSRTHPGAARHPTATMPQSAIVDLPALVYFHENQFSYPQSPRARTDHHYGYTNLMSAMAADACVFNSHFHRCDLLGHASDFVKRMPDGQRHHDMNWMEAKSHVIEPGIETVAARRAKAAVTSERIAAGPIRIGWVSRWEHDKRPDRLVDLCHLLRAKQVRFELILLGHGNDVAAKTALRTSFARQVMHEGWVEDRDAYCKWLAKMDVVVSTADHEFFGIGVCEAASHGAVPVVPNRLSYPELFPRECLYDDLDDAVRLIGKLAERQELVRLRTECGKRLARLDIRETTDRLDELLEQVARSN
ncbi:MAG: DUF3524 domain-containing protein [Planctomycetota bacterium]